jgi:hypothetical protein
MVRLSIDFVDGGATSLVVNAGESDEMTLGEGEFLLDSVLLPAPWSARVETGEFAYTETGGFVQTLPVVREVYFIAWFLIPFAIILGLRSVIRAFVP